MIILVYHRTRLLLLLALLSFHSGMSCNDPGGALGKWMFKILPGFDLSINAFF